MKIWLTIAELARKPLIQAVIVVWSFVLLSYGDLFWYEPDRSTQIALLINLAGAVVATILCYQVEKQILNHSGVRLSNLLVSTGIILVILHPTMKWWCIYAVLAITWLIRITVRSRSKPIFNPAAAGLVVAYLVTVLLVLFGVLDEPVFVSWWGADLQFRFLEDNPLFEMASLTLLTAMVYLSLRFRRGSIGGAFFLTYLVLMLGFISFSTGSLSFAIGYQLVTGSVAFMAFIMTTEPKTSPVKQQEQIIWGVSGGLLVFIGYVILPQYLTFLAVIEPIDLTVLLLMNLAWYGLSKESRNSKRHTLDSKQGVETKGARAWT